MQSSNDKLAEQQERLVQLISSIDKTLAVNTASLQEHMRRTEANEKAIQRLFEVLAPIQKHVAHVEGGLKVLGAFAVLAGVVTGILKLVL